jgi:hypothetical protein
MDRAALDDTGIHDRSSQPGKVIALIEKIAVRKIACRRIKRTHINEGVRPKINSGWICEVDNSVRLQ